MRALGGKSVRSRCHFGLVGGYCSRPDTDRSRSGPSLGLGAEVYKRPVSQVEVWIHGLVETVFGPLPAAVLVAVGYDYANDLLGPAIVSAGVFDGGPDGVIKRGASAGTMLCEFPGIDLGDRFRHDWGLDQGVERSQREQVFDPVLWTLLAPVFDDLLEPAQGFVPTTGHGTGAVLHEIYEYFAHRHLLLT